MENDTWYGVSKNGTLKKFAQIEKNERFTYWLKEHDTGKRSTTSHGNTYDVYEYSFYDKDGNPTTYEIDGWQFIKAIDSIAKNFFSGMYIEIKDPRGELKNFWYDNGFPEIIGKGVLLLTETSLFESWQAYDLDKLNQDLQGGNAKLKTDIEKLNDIIHKFTQLPWFQNLKEELNQYDSEADKKVIAEKLVDAGISLELYEKLINIK